MSTSANFEMTGILLGQELRKRKTPQEKIAIIQQTMEPGMTVSHVARLHGIQPSNIGANPDTISKTEDVCQNCSKTQKSLQRTS